ncbi:MAG: helix-turn-helix transcriptional regulator [Bacteroidales bacterium]|nr:helix-turn-helix transcriptional regulator [Bacteroidales bacterium]
MDIITRLKFFMDSSGLQSSQFADTCNIPRPTLSQLLNGRNKKVSDEIIAKVHSGFPELNVMWLLFGEGSMYMNGNTQFSQPQNTPIPHSTLFQEPTHQEVANIEDANIFAKDFSKLENTAKNQVSEVITDTLSKKESISHSNDASAPSSSVRKITSILVFYDDNSFESFVPSSDIK